MTGIWDLPIGRNHLLLGNAGSALNNVVGGWSLATIATAYGGLPFTPTYVNCAVDIGGTMFHVCRPNVVSNVQISHGVSQYFATTGGIALTANCAPAASPCAAFEQGFNTQTGQPIPGATIGPWQRPGAGQIGNVGRNSFRGPGFFQTDLAIAKSVLVTERLSLKFRADAFNIFNDLNMANPNPTVDGPFGGQITALAIGAIPRQLQFSLRASF